ncbi:MAG: hypothetical protein HOC41_08885 [Candidatus Marinimicrobia bacterium]|jgi:hypothetical protein|nr:hypothetical protein [Candidatus Neomarinimicrobiota bacterium]MBT4155829.1 hypothetical protein [Candidatus Neomarinimicrobiota bacterium]MBT4555782.1 hypothetical protein [Candidatus Neomarinimicrobiota bacterium]MBT4753202.1 hypothetical protein [Candidatus Neomarinimicrobiota bacterium]MBT5116220.1 hypothetical protein [Candidatus Neomarinimicrobiota bacterium]
MKRESSRLIIRVLFKYLLPLFLQKIIRGGESFYNYFRSYSEKRKIFIKICAPYWRVAHEWGDFHLAYGLKKYFERRGYRAIIQCKTEWKNCGKKQDIILTLRGLTKYIPDPDQLNIMWLISHPNEITISELELFDHVFVASTKFAREIGKKTSVDIKVLNQCTDPEMFYPLQNPAKEYDLLFVGNSRNIFRQILRDLLPTPFNLKVFGWGWAQFLDTELLGGTLIPNSQLNNIYNQTKILLNDHWQDMKVNGFISNRIYDGVASGSVIVSDKISELESLFPESVFCYETKEELDTITHKLLKSLPKARSIIGQHTFENRVNTLIQCISKYNESI